MIADFGTTKMKKQAKLYFMENKNGMRIGVSDFGATLVNVWVPDQHGESVDVVLGYGSAREYEEGDKFFGAIVGRIANRIGGARFQLNGTTYELTQNDNGNNLHSGMDFYNIRMWDVKEADERHVTFALHSPDGDQGYPGDLDIEVTYTLTDENEVSIHYYAVPKADTIINMTNHSYFNLNGEASGNIEGQEMWLDADAYTENDAKSIPTGKILSVENTPMDFRVKKTIGQDIEADFKTLQDAGGYDHNWVLNGGGYRKIGALTAKESGITMDVYTDLPGIQVYTGNFITEETGKAGAVYKKRQGVCFETQYFPDAVNHENFEGPVVKAGEVYETTTAYKFVR